MRQRTFSDYEYENRRRRTRRDEFLATMEKIIPWDAWLTKLKPYYYPGKRGRRPKTLETMLRMYLLQNWYALSSEGIEDAIYDSFALRNFLNIDFLDEQVPDARTLLRFRQMMEKYRLGEELQKELGDLLEENGLVLLSGAMQDAALIATPKVIHGKDRNLETDAARIAATMGIRGKEQEKNPEAAPERSVSVTMEETDKMTVYEPVKEGKVREIFDLGESLVMVATDRISAFDVILHNTITKKGTILTQMSRFWFDYTKEIIPNHMLSVSPEDMPEFFRTPEYAGKSMLCRKLTMLPIECIVRGYITGSGWASYKENGTVCGIALPEGLKECEKLPEPIYTPSTKAEIGDHDENIDFETSVTVLEKLYPGKGKMLAETIRDATISLYKTCADYALSRGIIIADTKFEFGLDEEGNVVLADEMLTPDSSRFWPLAGYEAGHGQPSFDKQYVRDYLKAHPESDYTLPDEVIEKTIEKYKEAYFLLTGEEIA